MKHIQLLLLITTTLLLPFTASAKKEKKKNKQEVQVEVVEIVPAEVESDNFENATTLTSPLVDSIAILETTVIVHSPSFSEVEPIAIDSGSDMSDNMDNDAEGGIPAYDIYPEWSSDKVNPYGIRLENTEDTISIDVSSFCFPLPNHYRVTSEFGFRRARHHYGIDLKLNIGDSVVSAFDGMVRIAKTQKGGYGKYVVIRHNNGLETVYGHFNKILVTEGQTVKAGELIGEGGNTGRSTGPHLHFEVRYLGQAVNPRDVIDFMDDKLCCHDNTLYLTKSNFEYIKEVEAIKYWTIKSGDTLSRIASKTGVSINRLCALNNIKRTSILRIGQRIRYN